MSSNFDEKDTVRRLLREVKAASFATLALDIGFPFISLINVVSAEDLTPLVLMSSLSQHYTHIDANPCCSLLITEQGKGDALAHPRVTLTGRLELVEKEKYAAHYLKQNPKAALYYGFGDFKLYALTVESLFLNGGFGKAFHFTWDDIRIPL